MKNKRHFAYLTAVALAALMLSGCTDATPKEVYVSNGGADTSGGTQDSPYLTVEKALSSIGTKRDGTVYIMSENTPFSDASHSGTVTYKAFGDNASLFYDEDITLLGDTAFEVALPEYSDKYIITGGNSLTMESFTKAPSKKSESAPSPNVILGGGEENSFTLTDGFVDTVATRARGEITGKSSLTIDGGTVRQLLIGAVTDEEDASLSGNADNTGADEDVGKKSWDTVVTDVTVTVNDGSLLYIRDGWRKPNAEGALTVIFNHNSAKKLAKNELTTVFDGGMWLIRSLDTDGNKIEATDKKGEFTVTGEMTAYTMSADGKVGFASKDGKLTLPEGTYTVDWTDAFTTSKFTSPTVEEGYSFEGFIETAPGVYEAAIKKNDTVYVSAQGNDENDGAVKQTPYKTLTKAVEALGGENGNIVILDEAEYTLSDSFDGTVSISGGKLLYSKEMELFGNTRLSDVTLVCTSGKGSINTGDCILEAYGDIKHTDKKGNEAPLTVNGEARKLSLTGNISEVTASKSTRIELENATVESINVSEDSNEASIKGFFTETNVEKINIASDAKYSSVQLISDTKLPEVSGKNVWTLFADEMSDCRIAFTDTAGTFALSVPFGKIPVAVDENGKEYMGEALTVTEEAPFTNYTENTYDKYINYRTPLKNTHKKLTVDKKLSVVYFGGSVTNGSVPESWRKLTTDWLTESFPEADITFTNSASGESGTFLGAYRVERDVIGYEPDLVFLEYCINDKYYYGTNDVSRQNAMRGCETIVREIKKARPDCDIVILIVTDSGVRNQALYPTALGHETVAKEYGISTVNVGQALMDHIKDTEEDYVSSGTDNEVWLKYFRDIVHLTEEGNKPYFYAIREFLYNSLFCTEFDGSLRIRQELPPVLSDHLNDGARLTVSPTEETATANGSYGITYTDANYPLNYKGKLTIKRGEDALLVHKMRGTELAIYTSIKGSLGGKTEYSVDGGEWQTVTHKNHGPNLVITDIPERVLPDGTKTTEHTISLRPVWDEVSEETQDIHYGIICTRDATVQSEKGDTDPYFDLSSFNLTLPEGSYTVRLAEKEDIE